MQNARKEFSAVINLTGAHSFVYSIDVHIHIVKTSAGGLRVRVPAAAVS